MPLPPAGGGGTMHDESLRDETPDMRPFHTSLSFPLMALAVAIAGAAFYAYYVLYSSLTPPPRLEAPIVATPPPLPQKEPVEVSTAPDVTPAASLPSLDNSDALLREKLVDLMGRVPFSDLVLPVALVRR